MSDGETSKEVGRAGKATRSDAIGLMKEGIAERQAADELIEGWWRYIPFIAVVAGLLTLIIFIVLTGSLIGVLIALILMWTVTYAVLAVLNYRLIKRMNEHARREAVLRRGMIEYLLSVAEKEGGKETAIRAKSALDPMLHDHAAERPFGIMLSPMTVVPIVGIVAELLVLRDLNRFHPAHEGGWEALLSEWKEASAKHGWQLLLPAESQVKMRPFVAYYLISLLLTPFLIYWYHDLIQEVNQHFRAQWQIEDQLESGLGT
jgi:Ca2+/Na+ antiporter